MSLLALGSVFVTDAQTPAPDRASILEERRKKFPDLFSLVEMAEAVPPEFAAGALLRIARSPKFTDPRWRREIVETAFERASLAKHPDRQRIFPGGMAAGNLAGMASLAMDMKLDRLSLQTEAVRLMLMLDRQAGRDLFVRMIRRPPRRLTCDDALIDYNPDYYALLAEIVKVGFSDKERGAGHHIDFLNVRISGITSIVEVGPTLAALRKAGLTTDEIALLAGRVAFLLDNLPDDDRSFTASLATLPEEMRQFPSASALLSAYRRLLVRSLRAARCADGFGQPWQAERDALAVKSFNQAFSSDQDAARAPIPEDLKPEKLDGRAKLVFLYQSPDMKRLHEKIMSLLPQGRSDSLHELHSRPEVATQAWRRLLDECLAGIEELKPGADVTEAMTFHRKGRMLSTVLTVVPPGADREEVLRRYIAFLMSSNYQQENLLEWLAQLHDFLQTNRTLKPEEFRRLLDAMESSGHLLLVLGSRLERVLSTSAVTLLR